MLKLITMPGVSESGEILVQAFVPERGLTKTAATDQLHPDIRAFVSGLVPNPAKLYVLVNALGAGEFYGSNINGDYFEENELAPELAKSFVGKPVTDETGYKSFLKSGVYRHHKNKDIQRSMGKVVCAVYNFQMHRVELVIEIDRDKARQEGHQDLVDQLDAGKNPAVSMGCKVQFDVCSICGNKSKTRLDYCHHAKEQMGQILANGQKVCVTNPNPRFFDISFVVIGADRTSYAMAKVARALHRPELSAELAERYGLRDRTLMDQLQEKLANKQKLSNLVKEIPAMSSKVMPTVSSRERDLPNDLLDRLSRQPVRRALTTLSAAGIVLKPAEYQRLLLSHMGQGEKARALAKTGSVFAPAAQADHSIQFGSPADYDMDVRNMLLPFLRERSMFDPIVTDRLSQERSLEAQRPERFADDAILRKIASGYLGYREQLLQQIDSMVNSMTSRDPTLLVALSNQKLEDVFVDTALAKSASILPLALLGSVPLAYLYGAHSAGTGGSSSSFGSWVADHPVLATSLLVGLTRLGIGLKQSGHLDQLIAKLAPR